MKKPKMFAVLPTMLTLGNAACGFGAITFAARVGPEPSEGNHLLIAGLLIFLGMVFDMLDGSAARWARQTSEFGAQLDSLCDGISFGVAPAFLMLQFTRHNHFLSTELQPWIEYHPRLLWVIAALFVLCVLLRLARFNVETDEDDSHDTFSGLPSPAAAGVIASFPIAMHGLRNLLLPTADQRLQVFVEWLLPFAKFALPLFAFATACLMVSRFRYPHFFNQLIRGQRSRLQVIQILLVLAAIYLVRELALPLVLPLAFCYFAFASPLQWLWRQVVVRRFMRSWS